MKLSSSVEGPIPDETDPDEGIPVGQPTWKFMTNHAYVLLSLADSPDLRVREIAERVGITERASHSILRDLENGGYVTKQRVGRRNHFRVNLHAGFKHPLLQHEAIGQLLNLLATSLSASNGPAAGRASKTVETPTPV